MPGTTLPFFSLLFFFSTPFAKLGASTEDLVYCNTAEGEGRRKGEGEKGGENKRKRDSLKKEINKQQQLPQQQRVFNTTPQEIHSWNRRCTSTELTMRPPFDGSTCSVHEFYTSAYVFPEEVKSGFFFGFFF